MCAFTQARIGNRFTLLHNFFRKRHLKGACALCSSPMRLCLSEIIPWKWLTFLLTRHDDSRLSKQYSYQRNPSKVPPIFSFLTLGWHLLMCPKSLPAQITTAEPAKDHVRCRTGHLGTETQDNKGNERPQRQGTDGMEKPYGNCSQEITWTSYMRHLNAFTKVVSCVWSKGLFLKFDVVRGMLCS